MSSIKFRSYVSGTRKKILYRLIRNPVVRVGVAWVGRNRGLEDCTEAYISDCTNNNGIGHKLSLRHNKAVIHKRRAGEKDKKTPIS